jgi:polyamine oxidase
VGGTFGDLVGVAWLAARSFDDGRTDVPGGVTGPVDRVVVVGAGIAGLTVANALGHAGVESVVLEARERIGGRLHTVDLGGSPIDLGGSWIHHPVGNPLGAFAEQVGVACRDGDPLPALTGYDCAEGRRLTAVEVEADLAVVYEAFPEAVDRLRGELGPDASVAKAIDRFIAGTGLAPGAARRARQGLRAVIEAEAADLPERQSLRWMWNETEYDGGYFGDLPAEGYASLVDAMASGVDVRLGVDVAEIVHSGGEVLVRSSEGTVETGSHVVVTVPLGVLKRGAPRFSPLLPPDRLRAIKRLGFGRYEKVALRFDRVLDATPDQAAQWVLGLIAEAVGAPCPPPTAVAVTSWATDPYSGGSYTHISPGASPADVDLLGEPIGGQLLFAGEHTLSSRMACTPTER